MYTFYLQNAGNCRVNNAVLESVDSEKKGATAEVYFDGISVSVNPSQLGKYTISIRVEDPSVGEVYNFKTVVEAY